MVREQQAVPQSQRPSLVLPRIQILDLEGYIVSESEDGGPFAYFVTAGEEPSSFLRVNLLPSPLAKKVIAEATLSNRDIWVFDPSRVGSRVYGEAPSRTIPDWRRPIHLLYSRVTKNWTILVINRVSELFVRESGLSPNLQEAVRPLLLCPAS